MARPRFLVLFPNEWDRDEFERNRNESLSGENDGRTEEPDFIYFGGDLFHFPGVLRLPFFNPLRFIRAAAARARRFEVDGVISSDEFLGAICAAAVAGETGLPGTDPAVILKAQHKFYSRRAGFAADPDTAVRSFLLPLKINADYRPELPYPFFVKPCKGTFSLFAFRIDSVADLRRRMKFSPIERLALRRMVRPFNRLLRAYTDLAEGADRFVGEELIFGRQVTVDGFAWDGEITIMGTVDSVMYPGTEVFERFEYPSRLPAGIVSRLEAAAAGTARALGFRHGQFNVELFYDEAHDAIKVIEINPRLSYQFADLYENVDGTGSYRIMLDLARGRRPVFERGAGAFRFSASFVLRAFAGKRLTRVPGANEVAAFNARYPESRIRVYGRKGRRFGPEMRASGNVRFGIVNAGARRLLDLFAIYEDALNSLDFRYE